MNPCFRGPSNANGNFLRHCLNSQSTAAPFFVLCKAISCRFVPGDVTPHVILPPDLQETVAFAVCDVSSPTSYFETVHAHGIQNICRMAASIRTITEQNSTASKSISAAFISCRAARFAPHFYGHRMTP